MKETRALEKECNDKLEKEVELLHKEAKKDGLFKVRLGDFKKELCDTLGINKDDLNVFIDMSLIIQGDARRINTLKIFDNAPGSYEKRRFAINLKSTNPRVKYSESITAPFRLTFHNLTDGSKFRDNLIYEKFKSGKQTYTRLSMKQDNIENLMIDFSLDIKNLSGTATDVLLECIRKKEKKTETQSQMGEE